jgi:hypothetical protein
MDEYFSYIGGLIGSCLVVFSILSHYSENSFFLVLASKMMIVEDANFSFGSFTFVFYLGVMTKRVLNTMRCGLKWERVDLLIRSI